VTWVVYSACVWSLSGGLLPSQGEAEYTFSGFIPTNKRANKRDIRKSRAHFTREHCRTRRVGHDPWRFECSNFTSKTNIHVVHVEVRHKPRAYQRQGHKPRACQSMVNTTRDEQNFKKLNTSVNTRKHYTGAVRFKQGSFVSKAIVVATTPLIVQVVVREPRKIWSYTRSNIFPKLEKSKDILETRKTAKFWNFWLSEFWKNRFDDFNKSIKSIKSQKIEKSIKCQRINSTNQYVWKISFRFLR